MALDERAAAAYSPNVLAFYGDCVYELLVRQRVVLRGSTSGYQSAAVGVIEPLLTEREADILRRGRNAGGISVPKSAKPSEYRRATALETLFGYLSLSGQEDRLRELFDVICEKLPPQHSP